MSRFRRQSSELERIERYAESTDFGIVDGAIRLVVCCHCQQELDEAIETRRCFT